MHGFCLQIYISLCGVSCWLSHSPPRYFFQAVHVLQGQESASFLLKSEFRGSSYPSFLVRSAKSLLAEAGNLSSSCGHFGHWALPF